MLRAGLALVPVLLVVGWTALAASAATCDDYSNQAQAQRAKDTGDADGDGIYCESQKRVLIPVALTVLAMVAAAAGGNSEGDDRAPIRAHRRARPEAGIVRQDLRFSEAAGALASCMRQRRAGTTLASQDIDYCRSSCLRVLCFDCVETAPGSCAWSS